MARFDVYQLRGGLVLDCQSDGFAHMPTRFVVPLEPPHEALRIHHRLNPQFQVHGRAMVMVTQLAGTVRVRDLGDVVAALTRDEQHLAAQGAIDMLTSGV